MHYKIKTIAKSGAADQLAYQNRMEKLQRKIVEADPDELGLQARKLKKMEKKHLKANLMDKVKQIPYYQTKKDARQNAIKNQEFFL